MSNETPAVELSEEEQFAKFHDELEAAEKAAKAPPEPAKVEPEAPVAAPVTAEAPAEPAPAEPFPGFSALPEEVKAPLQAKLDAAAKAEQLQKERDDYAARWKAQHGQLAPIQRQNAELRRMLESAPKKPATPPTDPAKLEAWRQAFPEESEAILGLVNPLAEQMKAIEEEKQALAASVAEMREEARRARELAELTQYRPTWQQDLPTVQKWIEMLPPEDQEDAIALYHSPKVKDVKKLWQWFGREEQLAQAYLAVQGAQNTATPVTPTPARKTPAVDPNPRNRQSPVPAANVSNSEEAEYAAFATAWEAEKARARR